MCFSNSFYAVAHFLSHLSWITTNASVLAAVTSAGAAIATTLFTHRLFKVSRRQGEILEATLDVSRATAEATKKSAEAAKQSADVAVDIMQTARNSERAYVFLDIDNINIIQTLMQGEPNDFAKTSRAEYTFRNYGRTPAILEEVADVCAFYVPGQDQQAIDRVPKQLTPGTIIGSGTASQEFNVSWNMTHGQVAQTEREGAAFIFSGSVRYRDVFGISHMTQFHTWLDRRRNQFIQHNSRDLNGFD